jgi:hypothetical protein
MLNLILNLVGFVFGFYLGIKISKTVLKHLDKK